MLEKMLASSKGLLYLMAYCSGGPLISAKFILMSIYKTEYESITNHINQLFKYPFFNCLPLQTVHVLLSPYLLFYLLFLARMFSRHVCLEKEGSVALVVAVFTGKRLLTSVRLHVVF